MNQDPDKKNTVTLSSLGGNSVALVVGVILSSLAALFAIAIVSVLLRGAPVKTSEIILFAILFLLPGVPGFLCLGMGLAFRKTEIDFEKKRLFVRTMNWFGLCRAQREIDLKDVKFVEISAHAGHGKTGQIVTVSVVLAVYVRDEPIRRKARVPLSGEITVRTGSASLKKLLHVARALAKASGTRLMGPKLVVAPDPSTRLSALKMKDLVPTVLEGPSDERQ